MVQINFGQREVSCKLVYYGPGMSGKTTNLEIIHQKAPDTAKGEMVSIATETDRTLYFDFLPLDLGQVAGMHTKFQLYTVPGQIYYNATRKLVLQGVDGVIFVADSQAEKMDENHESLQNLRDNLAEMGLVLEDLPFVLQWNKRDLPTALPVADLNAQINVMGVPSFEAVAKDGKGVFPTLKELSKIVIDKLNREHAPARRRTATGHTPVGGQPATPGTGSTAAPAPQPPPRPAPAPGSGAAVPPATHPSFAPTPRAGTPAPPQPPQPPPQPPQPPPRPAMPAPQQPPQAPPAPQPTPPPPQPAPQTQDPQQAKARHLAKARPPSLDQRRGAQNQVDLGPTDPHLRRYRDAQNGGEKKGGMLKFIMLVLLTLVIILVLLILLMVFVPAVDRAIRRVDPTGLSDMVPTQHAATAPAPAPATENDVDPSDDEPPPADTDGGGE